jgi:hypothetical protein
MARTLAVLFAAALAVPVAARAQDAKSADLAKQFVQLLDQKKLDAIATADPQTPGTYAAALYFPGTQLLVVSAKYAAPALMNDRLVKKDYHEAYVDLSSASIVSTKVFVMDMFADGLVAKPKADVPADSLERAGTVVTFDGDYKKAKLSEAEYTKSFDQADADYARILQLLITKLKSGT